MELLPIFYKNDLPYASAGKVKWEEKAVTYREKEKENSTEQQKINVEAEVYNNNKMCD